MADQYTTVESLRLHWPAMPTTLTEAQVNKKIEEAAIEINGLYPTIEERITAGTLNRPVVELVSNRMVKRALSVNEDVPENTNSVTAQTGPFTGTLTFANPEGNMYLSKADRRLLDPARANGPKKAFTIHPGGWHF